MIDLRSDTVTRPTEGMRAAMAAAEVGDDVYGEDPTVNQLQEGVAKLFGMEAALFVPSGTMANEIAVNVHTEPGQEVILEASCHIYNSELAMMAAFSGVLARPIPTDRGYVTVDQVEEALRPSVYYLSRAGLIAIENTHNMKSGAIYPEAEREALVAFAKAQGIPVHLDGARIFNAAVATGRPVSELVVGCDSVMFCISKGLGAPVGSLLVGGAEFIERARKVRKMLGGGMRQAGVLAAAGLYALEHHIERLAEDHENARLLAERLAQIDGLAIDPVETNIVIFDLKQTGCDASAFLSALRDRGVLAGPFGGRGRIRMVIHLDVSREDIWQAAEAVRHVLDGRW
ncbi:MAG: low-specificity L-threonine aldolase [Candidatus Bipolaricaulia bacterium]